MNVVSVSDIATVQGVHIVMDAVSRGAYCDGCCVQGVHTVMDAVSRGCIL